MNFAVRTLHGLALALAVGGSALGASITDFCVFADQDVTLAQGTRVTGLVGSNDTMTIAGAAKPLLGMTGGGTLNVGTTVNSGGDIAFNGDVRIGGGTHVTGNVDAGGWIITGTTVKVTGNVTAGDGVSLGGGADVLGNVSAGGTLPVPDYAAGLSFNTGTTVQVYGDVIANGDVSLGGSAKIHGNLTRTGGLSGGGTVLGTDTVVAGPIPVTPAVFTPVAVPGPTAVVVPGATDVTSSTSAGTPLLPGNYHDVILGSNRDLHLVSGVYEFNSIHAGGGFDLYLDLTGGPLTILVDDFIQVGTTMDVFIWDPGTAAYVKMGVATADPLLRALAAQVFTEVHGPSQMGGGGEWFGTLFVPGDSATFGSSFALTGSVYSGEAIRFANHIVINCAGTDRFEPLPSPGPGAYVPEPGTLLLIGVPVAGVILRRRRRNRRAAA